MPNSYSKNALSPRHTTPGAYFFGGGQLKEQLHFYAFFDGVNAYFIIKKYVICTVKWPFLRDETGRFYGAIYAILYRKNIVYNHKKDHL